MFAIDSRDTLHFAREHAVRLNDVASHRKRRASWKRRSLVAWLRRHVCRFNIDTAPVAHHPA